ncbi:MAG TPA: acyl-CoA dehydrogenase family protein [Jatrophihabitans sp.]|nr:acyl-CoA dehydrogenase family protein [Jatrophihabitans sp.]
MTLSDEQRGLRDSMRSVLQKRSDSAAVRRAIEAPKGYDEALWHVLCAQIGVAALGIPERFGGVGAGRRETQLVLEELGRMLTPSPMLGSAVLTASFLLELGDHEACARLLPRIAAGAVGAVAQLDAEGTARYVLDGDMAEILLVVDRADAYEVDPAAVVRAHTPTMDATRRLATVTVGDADRFRLNGDAVAALDAARESAVVALSGEQVGGAARILEMTVEYTKVRYQFGRAIGSFQALKHRMADLHVLLEAARSASYAAADGAVHPSVAKAFCSQAFHTIAAEAIQLHGGIAITWEHDAQLYFKRAHGSAQLFGAPRDHVARLAAVAGLSVDKGAGHG